MQWPLQEGAGPPGSDLKGPAASVVFPQRERRGKEIGQRSSCGTLQSLPSRFKVITRTGA